MLNRAILFLVAFFITVLGFAKPIKIKGKAKDFEGRVVRLKVYGDYISMREIELDKDTISIGGDFSLKSDFNEITYVKIQIDNIETYFFVLPGDIYEVSFPDKTEIIENEEAGKLQSFFPIEVSPQILNTKSDDINSQIFKVNEAYNTFLIEHIQELTYGKKIGIVEMLHQKLQDVQIDKKSPFVTDYIRYKIAGVEMMKRVKNNENFLKNYIYNQKPLYNNPEYMEVFNQFFQNYFTKLSLSKLRDSVLYVINQEQNYNELNKLIAKDTLMLPNDTLRELVMIKGLYEIYHDKDFSKDAVVKLLHHIAVKSHISKHREYANSILFKLDYLKKGNYAPNFVLFDLDGNKISLQDYRGKAVCLNFWSPRNIVSLEEMKMADTLQNEFNEKIVFIHITIDEKVLYVLNFIKDYKITNSNILLDPCREIAALYNISSIPTFVLIDEQGYIIDSEANKPSEGLREVLYRLFQNNTSNN